ncbi:MAG: type II toxin-antitoxin system RelE family toxin [Candidatus Nanoarchaeia archaeon]
MYILKVKKSVDNFLYTLENYDEIKLKIQQLKHFKSSKKLDLDIKKMQNIKKNQEFYRLRIGDVRVIFQLLKKENIIWVKTANFRGKVY